MKKAFTLIELLIVVAIIAILAAIAVPNFLEAQTRAKVSRVLSDQRTYATALETYMIDNSAYPTYYAANMKATKPAGITDNINTALLKAANVSGQPLTDAGNLPTFAFKNASGAGATAVPPVSLTSPVSYLSTYVPDTFASNKQLTFAYVSGPAGFLVWSPGPDGLNQLNGSPTVNSAGELIIYGGESLPSPYLITGPVTSANKPAGSIGTAPSAGEAFTYDATNGTASAGDTYRTK